MIENIRLSFQGIVGHKMRSFLTMLGIIIGIAAIIAIVSTIKGTNDQIKNSLVGAGTNVVNINTQINGMEVLPDQGVDMSRLPIISDDDLEAIKQIDGVSDAAKYHKCVEYNGITYKNKSDLSFNMIGCDADYLTINGYQITKGRSLVADDFKYFRNVCVLENSAVDSLFDGEDPIGQVIELKGIPFTVVGLCNKMDGDFNMTLSGPEEWYTYFGYENQSIMVIPDSSWQEVYYYDQPYQLVVKAKSTEEMASAGKKVADYLNDMIKTSKKDSEDTETVKYRSENTLEKAKELQDLSSATSRQLIWIAGISLLVGGIGVMNIMLVSVTERTREIGLKKALGARRKVILGQFLTEAAVLTSLGGILGVIAGIGLSYLISKIATVPVSISIPAIVVSVGFSMVIGIIFGLIPSIKASKLDPIDALRYE